MRRHFSKKAGGVKFCKNAGLFSAAMARMPSRGLRLVFCSQPILRYGVRLASDGARFECHRDGAMTEVIRMCEGTEHNKIIQKDKTIR